jgi:hypothetical protein
MLLLYKGYYKMAHNKEYMKNYWKNNPDKYEIHKRKTNIYSKNYAKTHKENKINYDKNYRLQHKSHYKEIKHKYNLEHKEQTKEYNKNYKLTHKDQIRNYNLIHKIQLNEKGKLWRKKNPDKAHKIGNRQQAKRKRNLGYIPINKWFVGNVGHHLTKEYVIYIPKELHISIPHNVQTGYNMNLINYEALKWYYGNKPQSL